MVDVSTPVPKKKPKQFSAPNKFTILDKTPNKGWNMGIDNTAALNCTVLLFYIYISL